MELRNPISILLGLIAALVVAAVGLLNGSETPVPSPTPEPVTTAAPVVESAAPTPLPAEESAAPAEPDPVAHSKVLVACFSATGTTGEIAEKIAQATGGDLFWITPARPYSSADLNYNSSCRANDEQNDPDSRPAIAEDCVVADWEIYDVVFLGHPIWWGIPPKIMRTFAESYDWTGKTIVGFCTSGSSRYSNSGLPELTQGAEWLDTKRVNGMSQTDVDAWVAGLDLAAQEEEESAVSKLEITFNGHTYTAALAENASAEAFADMLRRNGGAVTVAAHDYGSFEKVGDLPETLPRNDESIQTKAGDLILYQGTSICLYYSTNSWNFTRLGWLEGDLSGLKADLGSGNVDITYTIKP